MALSLVLSIGQLLPAPRAVPHIQLLALLEAPQTHETDQQPELISETTAAAVNGAVAEPEFDDWADTDFRAADSEIDGEWADAGFQAAASEDTVPSSNVTEPQRLSDNFECGRRDGFEGDTDVGFQKNPDADALHANDVTDASRRSSPAGEASFKGE